MQIELADDEIILLKAIVDDISHVPEDPEDPTTEDLLKLKDTAKSISQKIQTVLNEEWKRKNPKLYKQMRVGGDY